MRFIDYLINEAAVGSNIAYAPAGAGVATIMGLIEKHCSDALWMVEDDCPLWRGMHKAPHAVSIIDPSLTQRKSENTTNYYTLILDNHPERVDWPKRSRSLITTTDAEYADSYVYGSGSSLYAVIPFDGVKVGAINEKDMFVTRLNSLGVRIESLNPVWEDLGMSESNWGQWVEFASAPDQVKSQHYKKMLSGANPSYFYKLIEFIEQVGFMEGVHKMYSTANMTPAHSVHTTATLQGVYGETWVGGKCLLIEKEVWEQLAR